MAHTVGISSRVVRNLAGSSDISGRIKPHSCVDAYATHGRHRDIDFLRGSGHRDDCRLAKGPLQTHAPQQACARLWTLQVFCVSQLFWRMHTVVGRVLVVCACADSNLATRLQSGLPTLHSLFALEGIWLALV